MWIFAVAALAAAWIEMDDKETESYIKVSRPLRPRGLK